MGSEHLNPDIHSVRLPQCRSFAAPRKVQSTAPRRTAHLEHTNTPRIAFFSVRAAVSTFLHSEVPVPNKLSAGFVCTIAEQVKPAYKSWRHGGHHGRGGSCGTATWFTRATIECALFDLAKV